MGFEAMDVRIQAECRRSIWPTSISGERITSAPENHVFGSCRPCGCQGLDVRWPTRRAYPSRVRLVREFELGLIDTPRHHDIDLARIISSFLRREEVRNVPSNTFRNLFMLMCHRRIPLKLCAWPLWPCQRAHTPRSSLSWARRRNARSSVP